LDSRTVTVVRFPIEERRVETECAERAFERSSVNPRKRERVRLGDPRIQDLLLIKGDSEEKQRAERPSAPKDVNGFDFQWREVESEKFQPDEREKGRWILNVSASDIGAGPISAPASGWRV
jgi:hypothetical protein